MHRHARTAFFLLTVFVGGCSNSKDGTKEFGIGVAYNPREEGHAGDAMLYGTQIAVNFLNAEQKGRNKFRVITAPPDLEDPITIANQLREDPAVIGVVGPRTSGEAYAAVGVYSDQEHAGRHAVVHLSPTATSPGLSGINKWFFRVVPNDNQNAKTVAQFLLDTLRLKRASVVYENNSYGRDFAKVFIQAFRASYGTVISRSPLPLNSSDSVTYAVYAAYLKKLNPEVIVFPGSAEMAVALLRALKNIGTTIPIVGGDDMAGIEAQAAEFPSAWYVAYFNSKTATTQQSKDFDNAFVAAFKVHPDQRAAMAFDAAMLIGRAALAAGPDRTKIRDYIESVGKELPAYEGIGGAVAFDARHDVGKSALMKKVGK
jgi:branched-chain amino acid transport system substrate-binding protein